MKHALLSLTLCSLLGCATESPSEARTTVDAQGTPHCTATQTRSCYERAQRALERDDFERANLFFKRACASDEARGCFELGHSYNQGRGVQPDLKSAAELWGAACSARVYQACNDLGTLKLNTQDIAQRLQAKGHFRSACKGGVLLGCHNLAVMYDQALAGERDVGMANKLFKIACERGLPQSCHNLGVEHQRINNLDAAMICFERGCKGGYDQSCQALDIVRRTAYSPKTP